MSITARNYRSPAYDALRSIIGSSIEKTIEGANQYDNQTLAGKQHLQAQAQEAKLKEILMGKQHEADLQGAKDRAAEVDSLHQKYGNEFDIGMSKEGVTLRHKDPKDTSSQIMPGQKAQDEAFGKVAADYAAEGGSALADKNIGLLDSAAKDLTDPKTRPSRASQLLASIPIHAIADPLRNFFTPESVATENKVKTAFLGNLKSTVGGRVSNQEMQTILNTAYDPKVEPEENQRRVMSQVEALKAKKSTLDNSVDYFKQSGGTLSGMPSNQPPAQQQAPAAQGAPEGLTPAEQERLNVLRAKHKPQVGP